MSAGSHPATMSHSGSMAYSRKSGEMRLSHSSMDMSSFGAARHGSNVVPPLRRYWSVNDGSIVDVGQRQYRNDVPLRHHGVLQEVRGAAVEPLFDGHVVDRCCPPRFERGASIAPILGDQRREQPHQSELLAEGNGTVP